jgi:hypothetical protein
VDWYKLPQSLNLTRVETVDLLKELLLKPDSVIDLEHKADLQNYQAASIIGIAHLSAKSEIIPFYSQLLETDVIKNNRQLRLSTYTALVTENTQESLQQLNNQFSKEQDTELQLTLLEFGTQILVGKKHLQVVGDLIYVPHQDKNDYLPFIKKSQKDWGSDIEHLQTNYSKMKILLEQMRINKDPVLLSRMEEIQSDLEKSRWMNSNRKVHPTLIVKNKNTINITRTIASETDLKNLPEKSMGSPQDTRKKEHKPTKKPSESVKEPQSQFPYILLIAAVIICVALYKWRK